MAESKNKRRISPETRAKVLKREGISTSPALKERAAYLDGPSAAEEARAAQGPSSGRPLKFQADNLYPGKDSYQNGIIEKGSKDRIYTTNWGPNSAQSGYFTDKATVDSCKKDGVLDSNKLGQKLQTAPSNLTSKDGSYQHKPNCTAYRVDWDKLEELKGEDPALHRSLTNEKGDIRCAFGRVGANPQYGKGGGNQYHIEKNSFKKAIDRGVFKEDPANSYSEKRGNLKRKDIPARSPELLESKKKLAEVAGKERAGKEMTGQDINFFRAPKNPKMPYMAKADQNYIHNEEKAKMPLTNQRRASRAPDVKSESKMPVVNQKAAKKSESFTSGTSEKMSATNAKRSENKDKARGVSL